MGFRTPPGGDSQKIYKFHGSMIGTLIFSWIGQVFITFMKSGEDHLCIHGNDVDQTKAQCSSPCCKITYSDRHAKPHGGDGIMKKLLDAGQKREALLGKRT
jgi:hypothetical protein